MLWIRQQYS